MANYSNIKGFTVQTVSSDPIASQIDGGSWASGGTLNERRYASAGGGTQTAAWMAGGYSPTHPTPQDVTASHEQYDGSSWTETTDLNTARYYLSGAGTQTAGIAVSGLKSAPPYDSRGTELWNGSAWTETSDTNQVRYGGGIIGTSTANVWATGLAYPPNTVTANVEQWDGSSWTEVNNVNVARSGFVGGGSGVVTAGALVGGSPLGDYHEYFDGTNWTEQTGLDTDRTGGSVNGSQTSNIYAGGDNPSPGFITKSEAWNGTSWTETADLSLARSNINGGAGTGSLTAGIVFGGYIGGSPDSTNSTEEWTNGPATFQKTIEGQLFF